MSRIFEALKYAQMVRAATLEPKAPGANEVEVFDRRGSRRWSIDIPVYVYGHNAEKEPFHEEAHTLRVNANGALLLLSVLVRKGQRLLLTNAFTQREQDCSVVYLGMRRSRTIETGIAFPNTNSNFWQPLVSPQSDSAT